MHQTRRWLLILGIFSLLIVAGCKNSPLEQMNKKWRGVEVGMDFNVARDILGPPTKTLKSHMDGDIVSEGAYSWHVEDGERTVGFFLSVYEGRVESKDGPHNVIPDYFKVPNGVIERGASTAEVREILGEPLRVNRFAEGESWFYELSDGKAYIVTFEGTSLLSITKKK